MAAKKAKGRAVTAPRGTGDPPAPPPDYAELLAELKARIAAARLRAGLSVNRELILLYWSIGKDILDRQDKEGWGAKVIDRLATDLARDFPGMSGLSARNLKYMRAFAEAWPEAEFVQQVAAQLPWGHNVRLLEAVKEPDARTWYARQAIENGWSRNVLAHQIDSGLFKRQGRAITNFERTLPAPQSELAQQVLKDPYSFEFLSLGADMKERDLELSLIEHVRALILELGKGFAFVGSQYHLEVAGQDYYLDLLFYHLRLRCYVVIELKIEDFKPEFAGKMNFYLSAVDDLLRHIDDKPSIGIILCQRRNDVIVEYALRDAAKPMGVARYNVAEPLRFSEALPAQLEEDLPTPDELRRQVPMLSMIKLRLDVERAVRDYSDAVALEAKDGIASLSLVFRDLLSRGVDPSRTEEFLRCVRILNDVIHGNDVAEADMAEARSVVSAFLAELSLKSR